MRNNKPLNITLPPRVRAGLDRFCLHTERKRANVIADLLRLKLREEGFLKSVTGDEEVAA